MFKKILLVLVVLIAGFAIYVATLPEDFVVERSEVILAPPDKVFAQVNDFGNWKAWSPWEELDPNMKRTFSTPSSGKGAKYHWDGDSKVGEGEMEIVESQPNELVRIKLSFKRPMEAVSDTEFKLREKADATTVTWKMSGKNNFVGKAMCLVMGMQKTMEAQFDKGLKSMKAAVEAPVAKDAQPKLDLPKIDQPKAEQTKEK